MEPILHHGKLKGLGVTVEGSHLAPFFIYSVVTGWKGLVWSLAGGVPVRSISAEFLETLQQALDLQKCKMRGLKSVKWGWIISLGEVSQIIFLKHFFISNLIVIFT